MKRAGYLFEAAFSRDSIFAAHHAASRGKRMKRACFEFEKRLALNIDNLYEEVHSGKYRPRPYFRFDVYEPKRRTIYAPAFRDLVVQHAIYKVILPIFDRTFIHHSFACRIGKGTHSAADYSQWALASSPVDSYTLKLDIRKFFYRIDRDVLRGQVEKKIKDDRFVDVMMLFAEYGEPVGIPIGNLLSQIYALVYLNPLDHFVKRTLKVKKYCRYVDDFILFGLKSLTECKNCLDDIVSFLWDKLRLELSRCSIARRPRGVNFVGYRTWASKRFVRKHSLYTFRKSASKGKIDSIVSCLGHARKTHSINHMVNYLQENNYGIYLQLPKVYRQC